MYVGFQQIDSAQQNVREAAKNSNQTGLLLDLIEIETSRAGQGAPSDLARCLIAPSGSSWADSCKGHYVNTNDSAHGLAICRKAGDEYIRSLLYVSGPITYDPDTHKDLRCEQEQGPFFSVYSVQASSTTACPELSDLPAISQSNLRSENLCEAQFDLSGPRGEDVVVSLSTSGRLVSELSGGNVFSFKNNATQSVEVQLSTVNSLLEQSEKYLASFEQASFSIASGASTSSQIRLDRPALKALYISYSINGSTECTVTIEPGERFAEIPTDDAVGACADPFEAGDTLVILPSEFIAKGENSNFEVSAAEDNTSPTISLSFIETSVGYGQEALQFQVVADQNLTQPPTFASTASSKSPSITIASGSSAPSDSSIAANVSIQATSSAFRYTGTITPNTMDLGDQPFVLRITHPSAPDATQPIWITSEASVPTLSWLQNSAQATRHIENNRVIPAIILAEPPPTKETRVQLSAASAACGTAEDTTAHYHIENQTAQSVSCNAVILKAGASRTAFNLVIRPTPDTVAADNQQIKMTITASGNTYIPNENEDVLTVDIADYQTPRFDLENTTVFFAGSSETGTPDGLSLTSFLTNASTPPIGFASAANNELFLLEDAGSGAVVSGSIPIELTANIPSNSNVTIRAIPPAGGSLGRFSLTNPSSSESQVSIPLNSTSASSIALPFWVQNDEVQQGPEQFELRIERVAGNGDARAPEPETVSSRLFVTVADVDQCSIGGGMTIGDSRSHDFHTVGSDDMVNSTVTAATVRISSGYDSTTDKLLIENITPTTSTNVTTYSGGSVTYNGTTYSGITSKYYTNQGVLEISRSSAMPAPAMVKFYNESVFFQSSATDNSARSATFTLGDAQAWDMHEDGTTHYYRFVPDDVVFFNTARVRAASASNAYFGVPGYLATVTSRAENTFLAEKFNDNGGAPAGWLGGWDRNLDGTANEGKWIWMNGPEAGRRFLSGNTTSSQYKVVRGSGNGDGSAASITRTDYQQEIAVNGSDHTPNDSFELWNMRYNEYSESITNGKVTHPSNPYRFSNFARGEPNNCCGGVEHYLQMTGNSRGGRLWNDLPDELGSIIGNPNPNYGSPASPYYVRGYYQEFGGPLKSEFGFYNRKFSQTNNFTAGACSVTKSTAGVGLTQDSCEAWSDLTIGTGTSASSGFDFFGPTSSVSGQNISSARVSISSGYVSGTDELVIDGVTADTSTVGQKKYLNFAVNYNGTNYNNIDAIFFINQGVMEITRYTNANGSTKTTMPANAMVQLFNEKVEFVHDPTGSGLVSSSERQVTYTLGEAQAWFSHEDGGERYYRYIGTNMDWDDAKTAAASDAKKYFGVRGYLATLTSHAENKFLATRFNDNGGPPSGWLGASDSASEGQWKWVTGPENGRRFWKNNGSNGQYITGSGNGAGTPHTVSKSCVNQTQAWNNSGHGSNDIYRLTYGYTETLNANGVPSNNRRFANWSCYNNSTGYEPNDAGGEDRLQMTGSAKGGGMWNDLPNSRPSGDGVYNVKGYYIEYGGPSTYTNNFADRRLGATFRINPQECALVRVD